MGVSGVRVTIRVRRGALDLGHVRRGELHLEQLRHVYRSKVTVQPHLVRVRVRVKARGLG